MPNLETFLHSGRKFFQRLTGRAQALEDRLSQRFSMLIFLVVRFLLMSGMVIGFTWASLSLSP